MSPLRVLAGLALLAAGSFGLYELIESPRSGAFEPVVTHGDGHVVALTFDDGPTRGVTDRVLDVLEREHVPATFFVVGRAARREPALLRRMRADGDEIENHSDSHAHLNAIFSARALDAELANADDAIAAATGGHAHWLRPPFGARNAAVLDAARRHGLRVALWSAMLDETSPSAAPDALAEELVTHVGDGAIVVLHDGDQGRGDATERAYEAALTPRVIAALRARGFRFVTLDGLFPRK
ncbi:MAG TPA: polysaccharide deacetylase family protein [Candidatus Elarobacter sp.]|nr:polysaccharide deacetylase family protein [Candidatus Elarobacter sp.]